MKHNTLLTFLTCVLMLFSVVQISVSAEEKPDVVYTMFKQGNFTHSGDGTSKSPFNLFEDALETVADGGIIYIPGGSAFVNSDGLNPLQINKNVTISSLPGTELYSELSIRTTGIVLGANVTFKNIVLSFSNAYRPIVCANGYTLTMENVSYSSNARTIHLAGGSMYGIKGDDLSPLSGPRSRIVVTGKKTNLGNIYGGSINGTFDKDVDIIVEDVSGNNIGMIYAGGALEGYYNDDNFLDPDNEPEPPTAIPNIYYVSGNVSIKLNNTGIREIDGMTGHGKNAFVSVSTVYQYACDIKNIDLLNVKQGVFVPGSGMENGANISVESGGTLDLSGYTDYHAGDFTGGGTLILEQDGCLTIQGNCSGETELRTPKGTIDSSGIVLPNHLYIRTIGEGIFTFRPYPMQAGITLQKCAEGWKTSVQPEQEQPVLTKFEINSEPIFFSAININDEFGLIIDADVDANIGMIPLEYHVTYQGEKFYTMSEALAGDYIGYYEGNIQDLHMNFTPIEDTIMICNFSDNSGYLGEIASGVYDIEITAPVGEEYIIQAIKLIVFDVAEGGKSVAVEVQGTPQEVFYNDTVILSAQIADRETQQAVTSGKAALYINGKEYQTAISIDENGSAVWKLPVTKKDGFSDGVNRITVTYGGNNTYAGSYGTVEININTFKLSKQDDKLDVLFTNTTDATIENAVLLLALYNDRSLCKVICASESVNTEPKKMQSFNFDTTDTVYNGVKLFIWNSLHGMIPVIDAYFWKEG